MKVTLNVHYIDWEDRSTSFLDEVVFEGEAEELLFNLSGFLSNGDGEYQTVIKSTKVDR